jgi:hypothetical protein
MCITQGQEGTRPRITNPVRETLRVNEMAFPLLAIGMTGATPGEKSPLFVEAERLPAVAFLKRRNQTYGTRRSTHCGNATRSNDSRISAQ